MNAVLNPSVTPLAEPTVAPDLGTLPSYSSSAMLMQLSIGHWSARKLDKKVSQEVADSKHAARGAGNYNKHLLAGCAELDAVIKFVANTRNANYSMTMPWGDSGLRLVSTRAYPKYIHAMSELRIEFERLVKNFLDAYEWEVTQAQAKLGDMFNRDEYPTLDAVERKFYFKLDEIPVPDVNDFHTDLQREIADTVKEKYKKFYAEQMVAAKKEVWSRMHEVLARMVDRLDYNDDGTKKVFRDTLVDNVREMLQMLADYNVTNDPAMEAMRMRIEDALLGVTPDALREDAYLRRETQQKMADIIKGLPGLGF